jgi:integrase
VQARYTGPDSVVYTAPVTFETKGDAQAWLALRHSEIVRSQWVPEKRHASATTFADFAEEWLAHRQLKPRTRADYRAILDRTLLPAFGRDPLVQITRDSVRRWYADLDPARPTARARAYGLLRTIMASAASDEVVPVNPVHIRGAGNVKRAKIIKPATLHELEVLVGALPPRYRAMTLLAAWCALRFGELTELRRRDIDLATGTVHIKRAVVRAAGEVVVGSPKSDAGVRDVAIPPHLVPVIRAHLSDHVGRSPDALVFPAADGLRHMNPSSLNRVFERARAIAGRPDLTFHGLRHTGAVLAASTGATLAELMSRLGHSTPGAALRYQHAADGRDRQIAAALSRLAEPQPETTPTAPE